MLALLAALTLMVDQQVKSIVGARLFLLGLERLRHSAEFEFAKIGLYLYDLS